MARVAEKFHLMQWLCPGGTEEQELEVPLWGTEDLCCHTNFIYKAVLSAKCCSEAIKEIKEKVNHNQITRHSSD